jgi:Fas apoptotic inhibitory molecule (FAIM1).
LSVENVLPDFIQLNRGRKLFDQIGKLSDRDFIVPHLFRLFFLHFQGEFVENGTETHFTIGDTPAYIKAVSSCNKKEGLLYSLIVNDNVVPPSHI